MHYFKSREDVKECWGVEASLKAIKFGKKKFGDVVKFVHGTIADNEINKNEKFHDYFDLIVIEDVFGWVSREPILRSVANIDGAVKEGGFIFIRDFYPDKRMKNQNHHV